MESTTNRSKMVPYLGIFAAEESTEWWNHSLLYEVSDLLLVSRDSQVGDGPSCFLLCLEFTLEGKKKNVRRFREKVRFRQL